MAACAGILLLQACSNSSQQGKNTDIAGRISISGAFALYPLTVAWAEEFKKLHPDVQIDISAGGAGKGIADVLAGMVDIAMLSRDAKQEELQKGALTYVVAKDAVLPVINAHNPVITVLQQKGLRRDDFESVFVNGKNTNWGQLTGSNSSVSVHAYTRSDACGAASVWASYLGKEQEDLKGTGVFGDPGIADAVKSDKAAIGYNNVIYVYDIASRKKIQGLEVAKIDINKNGKIDVNEDFYESLDSIMAAIKDGRYPSPPSRNLYFVLKGKSQSPVIKAFLEFIYSKGQALVEKSGYIQMPDSVIKQQVSKL